ncbi:MAG: hypothetical protein HY909_18535 [Deltaproteobacteria bacterium]|nr:hypothetical protein [Deltaproteobacteria bacterium]
MTADTSAPEDPREPFVQALRGLQLVLFKYPVASQAAFQSLLEEGRRFALTDEGRAWQERLLASPLFRGAQALWEGATLNILEPDSRKLIPSALLDALIAAGQEPEEVLAALHLARLSRERA